MEEKDLYNSSDLFKRSQSSGYSRFFAKSEDIVNTYARYSIVQKKCEPLLSAKPWETGCAGVPVLWTPSTKTVYVDHTDTHTLVVGPTGSKKSRLVAMPTVRVLGSARENMIVTDPKAEIYNRTASYLKKQGYTIYVLNLREPNYGDSWNPLSIPYKYYMEGNIDKAFEFVNDVAENLINNTENTSDPFWERSAASFFFGLTILLFKYCKEKHLGKEYVNIGNVEMLGRKLLSQSPREARSNPQQLWKYAKSDPIIAANLSGTVETAEDTRGGISSVFSSKIRMFSIQPNLMDMLSNNSIELDDMEEKPTVVFLILPDEKTGYHGIGSLFIKQSYEYLIYLAQIQTDKHGTVPSLKRRVNYIVDEFASLPTIRDFPALISAARSRNIRFTLIIQSKHQLIQKYKDETDTIMDNCANWIVLTCREYSFLQELSELCGKTNSNPSEAVVPSDSIQRLDKNTGEALMLFARKRPFITHLPDIEKYDEGKENYLPLIYRQNKSSCLNVFLEKEEQKEENEQKIRRMQEIQEILQRNTINFIDKKED